LVNYNKILLIHIIRFDGELSGKTLPSVLNMLGFQASDTAKENCIPQALLDGISTITKPDAFCLEETYATISYNEATRSISAEECELGIRTSHLRREDISYWSLPKLPGFKMQIGSLRAGEYGKSNIL
jgi:hypothetical protein